MYSTDYMRVFSEATRIALKFEAVYDAFRIVTRLGHLSIDWDNVIVTGVAHYHLDDNDHPYWYVFHRIDSLLLTPMCLYRDSESYDDIVEAYQTFPLLLKYIKGFEGDIDWLADNPDIMALAGDFVSL